MELIGKKITRTGAFEKSVKSTIVVGKGKLKFSGAAMRKIGLFNKEIGIGYDGPKAYVYIAEEGTGNKVHDNGGVNTGYHSTALLSTFNSTEDTIELNIASTPNTFEQFPGTNFYEISKQEVIVEGEPTVEDLYVTDSQDLVEDVIEDEFPTQNFEL